MCFALLLLTPCSALGHASNVQHDTARFFGAMDNAIASLYQLHATPVPQMASSSDLSVDALLAVANTTLKKDAEFAAAMEASRQAVHSMHDYIRQLLEPVPIGVEAWVLIAKFEPSPAQFCYSGPVAFLRHHICEYFGVRPAARNTEFVDNGFGILVRLLDGTLPYPGYL